MSIVPPLARTSTYFRYFAAALVLFPLGYVLFALIRGLAIGCDDLAMLDVYNVDERIAVDQIRRNIVHRDLSPRGFYNYGYVFNTLTNGIVRILGLFGFEIAAVPTITIAARSLLVATWLGTLALLGKLLRDEGVDLLVSASVIVGLGVAPVFVVWSVNIHPDALLAFASLAVIAAQGPSPNMRRTIGAAAIAGVALGTKVSGVFLLPLVVVPPLVRELRSGKAASLRDAMFELLRWVTVAGTVALLVAIATNPTILTNFREFLRDLAAESAHVRYGHAQRETGGLLRWGVEFFRSIGPWVGNFLLLGGLLVIGPRLSRSAPRRRAFADLSPRVLGALAYLVFGGTYLVIGVSMVRDRYLIHLVPVFFFLGGLAIGKLSRRHTFVPLFALALSLFSAFSTRDTFRVFHRYEDPAVQARIAAGHWLVRHVPAKASIAFERYVYVPEGAFSAATRFDTLLADPDLLTRDYLVITGGASKRHNWKLPKTSFREGKFKRGSADGADRVAKLHESLIAPRSKFEIVMENPEVVVFAKKHLSRGRAN